MSRAHPGPQCRDTRWPALSALSDPAQVALEDYARALLRAASAEVLVDSAGRICGVHACGVAVEPAPQAARDLEDFARDLAQREGGGGLGWS